MESMDTTSFQLHFNQETNRPSHFLETVLNNKASRVRDGN